MLITLFHVNYLMTNRMALCTEITIQIDLLLKYMYLLSLLKTNLNTLVHS